MKTTHMTAERRVRAIFYWAHALGTTAEVMVPQCRLNAQIAVSTLQLLLIATRGHRSYTARELDTIYLDVGREFFISLEAMSQYIENKRVTRLRNDHVRDPDNCPAPVVFEKGKRYSITHMC